MRRRGHCLANFPRTRLALAGLLGLLAAATAAEPKKREVLHIGIAGTLFRDIADDTVQSSMEPFKEIMASETGLKGELRIFADGVKLGDELSQDKMQLGVFNGYEFAWARHKDPQLVVMAVAVNQDRHLHVLLVTRRDDPANDFAALKGKSLALATSAREFCRFFLEDRCHKVGCDAKQFFGKTVAPTNTEDALDDVVDGKADVVLTDGVGLTRYRERKPARAARLKVVEKSIVFPAAAIAYRKGNVDPEAITRMRESLFAFSQTPEGRQHLAFWKMTAFEDVPSDYDRTLADFVKAYPPPGAGKK